MRKKFIMGIALIMICILGEIIYYSLNTRVKKDIVCYDFEGNYVEASLNYGKHKRLFSDSYYYSGYIVIRGIKYYSVYDISPKTIKKNPKGDFPFFIDEKYSNSPLEWFKYSFVILSEEIGGTYLLTIKEKDGETYSYFGPANSAEDAKSINNMMQKEDYNLSIEKITDMDELSRKYHLELSAKDGLFYEQISGNEVVIIDLRNKRYALYMHSDLEAKLDENGVLKVVVSDRTANSETEISGAYAVIIHSDNIINSVEIEERK